EAMVGVPANTPVVNEGFWSAFKAFLQDIVSALTNFVASIDEVGVSRRQSFEVTGKTRSYAHIKEGRPGSDFNVAKPQGNIPRIIFIYTNKNAHSYSIWPDYSKRDYIELKVVENQGPDGLLHRLSRVAKIKITKQGQGDDGFSLIRIKGRKEDPKNFKKALKFFASYSHSYVPLPNDYIRLEVIDNADLVGLVRQLSVSGIEMTKLKGENGFCFIHIEGRYNLEKALQFFVDHPHYELSPQACKTLDHILNVLSTEKLDDAIEEALYLDSDDEPLSDSSVLEVKQAEPLSTSNNSAQQNQEDSAAMRRAIGSSELTAEIERTKRTIDAYQVRGEVVPSSISRKHDQLLKELERRKYGFTS
ncbi:MAG: hypothetical protein K0Q74_1588, partial [Gammaproteobacteria bacterium]|nr:hypothetical protein [Gammaproteobacteria bacterium]